MVFSFLTTRVSLATTETKNAIRFKHLGSYACDRNISNVVYVGARRTYFLNRSVQYTMWAYSVMYFRDTAMIQSQEAN